MKPGPVPVLVHGFRQEASVEAHRRSLLRNLCGIVARAVQPVHS